MTQQEMAALMEETFKELIKLREAGQKEYAHKDNSAFANFERIADRLGADREEILLVFLLKHLDGIVAHAQGHTSQREDVSGRIHDAIVYLILLKGMFQENAQNAKDSQ